MGNCGVGFAPVRPGEEDFLIELMESVEDIPGTALHEGIDWGWETFEQYLDSLDAKPTVMDVAAQVPHCAVRAYVMGERAHDDATHDEIAEMAEVGRARACAPAPRASAPLARCCTDRSTATCPEPPLPPTSCSPSAMRSAPPDTACSRWCPTR